jgi:hypothetical protein
MTGILDERLLFVSFGFPVSEKRAQKTIEDFLDTVNTSLNGHPVRFESIGRTIKHGSAQAVLGIWYPTDYELDAPLSVDNVIQRLKDFARGRSSWFSSMSLYFGTTNETVQIHRGLLVTYDEVLQSRDLYMLTHNLWPAEEKAAG